MKIAIDARALSWTGIGRYTRNLLIGLANQPSTHDYIVLIGPADVAAFEELRRTALSDRFSSVVVEGSYYSWQEQTILWWQLQKVAADVFHFTHFNMPLLFNRPYVVTIHDITRFIFPGQKRQDLLQQVAYEYVFKRAVERARRVICVSHSTAADLKSLPLQLKKNVHIIHEALDPSFFEQADIIQRQKIRMLLGSADPYLLYVGVWMSHKNINRLLAAFAQIIKNYPTLKLVLTGKPRPGYGDILQQVRFLKIEHQVIFAGFVPHDLLPALYAEATCFVLPSLYEGFGLPALEAAAAGVPVVASLVASLPEVMGTAAYYVNPEDVGSIARGIERVLQDRNLRETLIAAGRRQVTQFNWHKAAEEHVAVYEAAVS